MRRFPSRRTVLQSTATAGLVAIAGCTSAASDASNTTTSNAPATDTPTSDGECESTPTYTPASELTPPESLDTWLEDANGYDGEPKWTGVGRADVRVGHETDDGLAFAPAVVEVPPGTNVRWEWTGHGGAHNVVAFDGTFDSGRPNAQSGTSYHYIFDEVGAYPFVSEPDREDGMKGAVIVKEPPSTGYETVDEWVVHSSNFDGSVTDRTGADTARITVGAEGNGGNFAFAPPVLKVSPGTSVVWEWNGEGGAHNVAFRGADISSEALTPEPGTTFEHTFEESGIYRYACEPHVALGMRGAVIVE